jgi:hypothetical protein
VADQEVVDGEWHNERCPACGRGAASSRDDFEQLLTPDVDWCGADGAECRGRATAGEFFAEIVAQGVLVVDDMTAVTDTVGDCEEQSERVLNLDGVSAGLPCVGWSPCGRGDFP